MKTRLFCAPLTLIAALGLCANVSAQTQIEVSVTTNGPVGLAPVFGAFHDGSYDAFTTGGMASAGLEELAEVGSPGTIVGEATAAGANAAGFAPGGPFAPNGGTGSMIFTVDASENTFSIVSMVLPTNDWFIGMDGVDITSLLNASVGTSLSFDLSRVYDAGTEEEDFTYAPGGGLVGITTASTPPGGTATSLPISLVTGPDPFSTFANLEPAGFDTTTLDFTNGSVATVQLTVVPEPSSVGLFGTALLGFLGIARRRTS